MSSFQAASYEIPRTSGACAATGRALEPGEVYYAALVDVPPTEPDAPADGAGEPGGAGGEADGNRAPGEAGTAGGDPGLARVDVSERAWHDGFRPPRLFCFWKTTVPQPTQKKKLFVDDAVLMSLLDRLGDTDQPQRLAFRYVVALVLMRKKLLRFDGVESEQAAPAEPDRPARQRWVFTPKADLSKGPMGRWDEDSRLEVVDPGLDDSQIEAVTQQLGEILEAEL